MPPSPAAGPREAAWPGASFWKHELREKKPPPPTQPPWRKRTAGRAGPPRETPTPRPPQESFLWENRTVPRCQIFNPYRKRPVLSVTWFLPCSQQLTWLLVQWGFSLFCSIRATSTLYLWIWSLKQADFWHVNSSVYYFFHIDYIRVYHTASASRNMWHNWESEQSLCIILWVCCLGKKYTLTHVLDWQDIGNLRLTMPWLFRYSNKETIYEKKW